VAQCGFSARFKTEGGLAKNGSAGCGVKIKSGHDREHRTFGQVQRSAPGEIATIGPKGTA
jgi:hypothetical protein